MPQDAPHFRHLSHVTLYVPDLQVAVAYYQAAGLLAEWVAPSEPGSGQRARLSFPGGGPSLEVHTDARRQFTDVQLAVTNLDDTYRALSRQPAVVWLEPPCGPAGQRRATLRGPDGNVLILGEATSPLLRND
ncbi:VOC family protein [Deinococcus apachensis]|uniref:VOC family protein n=1 Tax=Deinococcus apachensis TaxID=309886 RepID=UPI0012FA2AEE|nr:VOC family protein [Deinococcus apachensis]